MFVNQGHENLALLLWFIAAAVGIIEMTMSGVVVCGVPVCRRPKRFWALCPALILSQLVWSAFGQIL